MALSHSKIYLLHSMHYFNMQSIHCSLPHLYGNILCPKIRKSLKRVNGVMNGITEPRHGYRIGQICQMQAMDARYYFIVVARSHAGATANASESEFDVVSCASVMEALQTMLRYHELLRECINNGTVSSISHFSKSQKNQFL